MKKVAVGLLVAVAAVSCVAPASQAGTLYATQFAGTAGAIIDTDAMSVLSTFSTGVATETGIAVGNTVRIINGFSNSGAGSEYDLNGNVINAGIYNNTSFSSLYDGTTDGAYNYGIDHNGNGYDGVFRFDTNWANPTRLFDTIGRSSGITYDAVSNSLWTTEGIDGAPTGLIRQYALDGTFLSEFDTGLTRMYAMAWDYTDDTLWMSRYTTNTFFQYDKSGSFIQSTNFGGTVQSNPFGLEFDYGRGTIPEPSTALLLGLGMLGAGLIRRKRRS